MKAEVKSNSLGSSKKKEYKKWKKSETKDGITEEIEVCEVENGFIVEHEREGMNKKGEYIHDCKKYISKENPLEEEEEKTFSDSVKEILDEIAESEGMINVE
jgi:hypothetical protein